MIYRLRNGLLYTLAPETGDGQGAPGAGGDPSNGDQTSKEPEANADADKDKSTDDSKKPDGGMDPEKAKLLKEVMKLKEKAKAEGARATETEAKLKGVSEKLAALFGVESIEDIEKTVEKLAADEEKRLSAAGEWDKLKERLVSEHKKEIQKLNGTSSAELTRLKTELEAATGTIRQLLVSNSFASSKFIADELVLSPTHAERLYGENFKVEDADGRKVVRAFHADGKPIVDAEGKPKSFDEALKELVDADPSKTTLFKPKAKPGAGSGVAGTTAEVPATKPEVRGASRIALGLAAKK